MGKNGKKKSKDELRLKPAKKASKQKGEKKRKGKRKKELGQAPEFVAGEQIASWQPAPDAPEEPAAQPPSPAELVSGTAPRFELDFEPRLEPVLPEPKLESVPTETGFTLDPAALLHPVKPPVEADDEAPVITREQIRALPRMYNIGKRPLSKLLGWGELTYTRLLDGRTPNRKHAEELRRLYDDPAAYAQLLERGRESGIITPIAYQKSRDAVDALLGDDARGDERIYAVADRLCVLAEGDVTPRALQVLLYYVHGWGFLVLSKSLFSQQPAAAPTGPEYEPVRGGYAYDAIRGAYSHANECAARVRREILSAEECALVDAVYACYGVYSGPALAQRARSEQPWLRARERIEEAGPEANTITAKSMERFFEEAPCPLDIAPANAVPEMEIA